MANEKKLELQADACRHIASSLLNIKRLLEETELAGDGMNIMSIDYSPNTSGAFPEIRIHCYRIPDDGTFFYEYSKTEERSDIQETYSYWHIPGLEQVKFFTYTVGGEDIYGRDR